jgi:hypothetical protein
MRTKGKFIFKKEWYSFCSIHHEYDEKCGACNGGSWYSIYRRKLEKIYSVCPKLRRKILGI